MAYSNLPSLDFFGDLQISSELIKGKIGYEDMVKTEFEHYNQLCGPCVGTPENEKLSNAQKEILLWHWRWGISMHCIQGMMQPQQMQEPNGSKSVMAPIIQPTLATAENFAVPVCESCLIYPTNMIRKLALHNSLQ